MSSVVSQDPEILGGERVFAGTRVPVKSLFDHLEAGDSIEEFLEKFPSVKREQVIALLEAAAAKQLIKKNSGCSNVYLEPNNQAAQTAEENGVNIAALASTAHDSRNREQKIGVYRPSVQVRIKRIS